MAIQTASPTGKAGSKGTPGTPGGTPPARTQREPFSDRFIVWVTAHKQIASWIGAIVIVAFVLFVWTMSSNRRAEEVASRELQGARFAFENQNLPLAASELARISENYAGTRAAQEGRLLLAQVRLLQGQPQQAVDVLRDFAPGAGSAYRAQAYGLLGAAYENLSRPREAADAYEKGSSAARLDFLKAQMLSDAARAWTIAGETGKALAIYQGIIRDFPKEGTVTEAKVRIGELTKGAPLRQ